jgi:hypothetical protein
MIMNPEAKSNAVTILVYKRTHNGDTAASGSMTAWELLETAISVR